MRTKSVLIALALATITAIISAKAQDLTPNRTQLQWENWGINIKNLVVSHTVKDETAPNDSLFVCLYLTVKNNDHYGKSFIPQNELKVVIGENNFDAADLDYGLDYIKNIEPTLLRERSCYFEIPKALFKDSFTIRFHSFLSSTEDIQVSITQSKPMPTPVAVATPEFTPESGYKVYHSAEDLKARTTPESTSVPRLVPRTWAPQDRVLILDIQKAINSHDWRTLTAYTDDGSVDYFGRPNTTIDYIRRDMQQDAKTYSSSHSTRYTDTFNREVVGTMIYDSITVYTEVQEKHGRLHKALTRLTVGYTLTSGVPTIHSLALKVLGGHPLDTTN